MDNRGYPDYRWVIFGLIILCMFAATLVFASIVPILGFLISDLNINVTLAGLLMSVVSLMMGFSMFICAWLINKIGEKKSLLIGMWALFVGAALTYFSNDYTMLFAARVISGFGYGIMYVTIGEIVVCWFPMNETPMIYAANTIALNIGSFLVMVITIPIVIAVKSWQNLYGIIAVCVGISALLWTFFGKNNKSKKNTAAAPEKQKKKESRMVLAFKYREIILLTVIMATCMAVFITFVTYLPLYLSGAYGVSAESAAVTASIIALAAMGGVILGGTATTAIGLRKPFIAPAIIIILVGTTGSLFIYPGFLLYIMAGCIGFGYNMIYPVLQTIPAEIKNSTPRLVSSAFAIIFGISSIISFFTPFFIGPATNYFGLRTALLMISMLLLPGIIAGIILPETGPRKKK